MTPSEARAPAPWPKVGAARSFGLKLGVSALATFSASSFWRASCHCMRVFSMENRGIAAIDKGISRSTRQKLPPLWLRRGKHLHRFGAFEHYAAVTGRFIG